MIRTKLWCIALGISASTLGGCGGASEWDDGSLTGVDDTAAEAQPGPAPESQPGAAPESVGQTQQAIGNMCKNVRIEVKNEFEDNGARPAIKVVALSYFNADRGSAGRWIRQGVSNRVIPYGDDYPYIEDLENADGDRITKWRIHHKHDLGNSWGSEHEDEFNTVDADCEDGMTFEVTVND